MDREECQENNPVLLNDNTTVPELYLGQDKWGRGMAAEYINSPCLKGRLPKLHELWITPKLHLKYALYFLLLLSGFLSTFLMRLLFI